MADKPAAKPAAKTAKGNSQVFDVSRPGKQAAAATSRPVIVTNRPMMQDPMMLSNATMAEAADNPGSSPIATKIKIQPLSAEEKKADAAPKKAEKASRASDLPTAIKLVDEADDQTAVTVKTDSATETKEPETNIDPATDAEPEAKKDDKPTLPNTSDSEASVDEKPADDSASDDEPTPTPDISNTFPTDDSPVTSNEGGVNEKAAAELEAEAKKQAALDEMVDNKEYYLPINSVEKRRSTIMSFLGVVLIIALGLFLVNMLMDVGTLQIDGIKPVTNFFGS